MPEQLHTDDPTPEATPERTPMSEERIAELREDVEDVLRETNSTVHRSLLNRYVGCLNECLDEITRQRAVIAKLMDDLILADQINGRWGKEICNQRTVIAERDAEVKRLREVITSVIDNPTISYREAERRFLAVLAGEAVPE